MARYTRCLDPTTGDRRWDAARGAWASAESVGITPELTIVQHVLATEEGSARRDPAFGVVSLTNAGANAEATWRQHVLTALARWIDDGTLRDVEVDAEVTDLDGGGAALAYTVSFYGRDGQRQATPRRSVAT